MTSSDKKILGIIHDLEIGGAEKAFSYLFSELKQQGYKTSVCCLKKQASSDNKFSTDSDLHYLGITPANPFSLIKKLSEKILEFNPDLIISFMDQTNIIVLLALVKLKIFNKKSFTVLVCERNNPARNLTLNSKMPGLIQQAARLLRNNIYRFADAICVQTSGAKDYFLSRLPAAKIYVVANFVEPRKTNNIERSSKILCVSRLVPEKGLTQIFEAFHKINDRIPEWRIEVYGSGPLQSELEQLINRLGLTEKIRLCGKIADLSYAYSSSSIFVLNSDYEGYPNALMEAMSYGCACIARDCDYGPSELISHNSSGLLLVSKEQRELENSIEKLALDSDLRNRLGQNAAIAVSKAHDSSLFFSKFLKIISDILGT